MNSPPRSVPAADHPPGYIVALASVSVLGFKSWLSHQIWSCVLGAAAIAVVGVTGRMLAGARVGLLGAGIAALTPNFWINDGLVFSETLVILTAAIAVLAAYAFWQRPTVGRAVAVGLAVAVFTLTRAEGLLFALVPIVLALIAADLELRRRIVLAAVATGVTLLAIAPWTIYNSTRFEHPVLVSTSLGWTMAAANCGSTYEGKDIGYYSYPCAAAAEEGLRGDASSEDLELRKRARTFMGDHVRELPWVVTVRVARTFGVFRPLDQVRADRGDSGRDFPAGTAGLVVFYALVPAAVFGVPTLRKRKIPVFPLLALFGIVVVTVAITFGQTRYRAPAEVSLVLLAAVGIQAALTRAPAPVPEEERQPELVPQ